eukprot:COSAG05_NODE_52_length_23775_cov_49.471110_12_plen_65_part_00
MHIDCARNAWKRRERELIILGVYGLFILILIIIVIKNSFIISLITSHTDARRKNILWLVVAPDG